MASWLKDLWAGFLVGVANIIPGVSGGTLLLVLGMYERVIGLLSGFKASSGIKLLHHGSGFLFSSRRKDHLHGFIQTAKALDLLFLTRVLLGTAGAILLLSGLMKFLLEKQFSNTYAFFFGLIVISTLISVRMLKTRKLVHLLHFAVGAVLTVAISASVNPAENARVKSEHYKNISESNSAHPTAQNAVVESSRFKYLGHYSVGEFSMSAASGAVSVSAMILPGISGSLVLILMNQYYEVISAVSGLKSLQLDYILFLGLFGGGMVAGLLLFARLVNFVFRRFHDSTMALLIGLMAGSLYALWPFKKAVVMDQYVRTSEGISLVENAVVYTNINILPQDLWSLLSAVILCAAGAGIMVLLGKYEVKTST
ncbi:MAG: DUF368 domain-containing protein [Chitinispirillaceae bacterium]